jgi:hypothetical protein
MCPFSMIVSRETIIERICLAGNDSFDIILIGTALML